jgi:hypothetical protein
MEGSSAARGQSHSVECGAALALQGDLVVVDVRRARGSPSPAAPSSTSTTGGSRARRYPS